jgi:hypothetical protein
MGSASVKKDMAIVAFYEFIGYAITDFLLPGNKTGHENLT